MTTSPTTATARRRVVITGVGVVSPLGLNAPDTWAAAIAGKSGMARITHFDPTDCPVQFAAEVKGYDFTRTIAPLNPVPGGEPLTQAGSSKDARRVGRFTHLGLSAGLEAYADSGLDAHRATIAPERMGVNIGVGMGGLPEIEEVHSEYLAKGYKRITPFFILQSIPNIVAGQLSILLNMRGPNLCNVTACTSSAHSLGESRAIIQRGHADVMLAGGAEAVICRLGIGGFASMKALSSRNEDPTRASRPFDQGRDGFVMGEGAAVVVLEEYEHARKRGAKIYAELKGYGLSGDAYHMTSPAPEGEGGLRAMKMAVADAAITPAEIDYVNAHGTSTPAGDAEEANAIRVLVGDAHSRVHVSSTKSMTGHLLGAAGAIEAFFSVMAIAKGIIPPTINLDNVDPACAKLGLDFVPHKAIEKKVRIALSNNFGFGGTNASLVFGRVE